MKKYMIKDEGLYWTGRDWSSNQGAAKRFDDKATATAGAKVFDTGRVVVLKMRDTFDTAEIEGIQR